MGLSQGGSGGMGPPGKKKGEKFIEPNEPMCYAPVDANAS